MQNTADRYCLELCAKRSCWRFMRISHGHGHGPIHKNLAQTRTSQTDHRRSLGAAAQAGRAAPRRGGRSPRLPPPTAPAWSTSRCARRVPPSAVAAEPAGAGRSKRWPGRRPGRKRWRRRSAPLMRRSPASLAAFFLGPLEALQELVALVAQAGLVFDDVGRIVFDQGGP